MSIYYTYYSFETNKGIEGLGYIGSRKLKTAPTPELEEYYGTLKSPKNLEFKENDAKDKIILGIFDSHEEALAHEVYLHNLWEVDINPHFANQARQTSKGFYCSEAWNKGISLPYDVWNKGKKLPPLTPEHKNKIRESCQGINSYKREEDVKLNMSKGRSGKSPWNKDSKGQIPANKGKKMGRGNKNKKFYFINIETQEIVYRTATQMCKEYGGSRTGYSRIAKGIGTVCNGWKLYDNTQK
jgi:hypothetical protein